MVARRIAVSTVQATTTIAHLRVAPTTTTKILTTATTTATRTVANTSTRRTATASTRLPAAALTSIAARQSEPLITQVARATRHEAEPEPDSDSESEVPHASIGACV